MAVTRIIANLTAPDPKALARFYEQVFGLDLLHDMGWIAFLIEMRSSKSSDTPLLKEAQGRSCPSPQSA